VEERPAAVLWCPRCLRPVGEAARCPACGLRQRGADAAHLRVVVHRLYEIGETQSALAAETASLRREQSRLLASLDAQMAAPTAAATREWRPGVVRGVLLGLGAALVALAALIFAVVAWVNLGDAGRAGLLGGATLAAVAAAAAARRRLPATAEALGGLALALALVDWYAVRRAGVAGGWSATAWWALGTGAGAAVAAAAGRWLAWQRLAAALLAQVSAVLAVATTAHAPWTVGGGLALAAAAAAGDAAAPARRPAWRPGAVVLAAGAALLELAAVGVVLASPPIHDLATAAGPAAALAAVALAPTIARATLRPPGHPAGQPADPATAGTASTAGTPAGEPPDPTTASPVGTPAGRSLLPGTRRSGGNRAGVLTGDGPVADALVAAAAGALLAAAGTLLAAVWESWALLAAVAVLGAAAVGVARGLPAAMRGGTALAGGTTLAVAVVGLLGPLVRALLVPLSWATAPWTAGLRGGATEHPPVFDAGVDGSGAAVLALLAAAAAAALAGAPRPGPRLLAPWLAAAVAAAAGVGVVTVLPSAAGWPLWAALLASTAAALAAAATAVLADRRLLPSTTPTDREAPAATAGGGATPGGWVGGAAGWAAVLGVLAACWALASEAGTVAYLGAVVAAAGVAAAASRSPWLRGGMAAAGAVALLGETAALVLHAGGGGAAAGTAMVAAAGALLLAGARWRRGTADGAVLERLGLAGQLAGVLLAIPDERWLAVALTAAFPALLLAGARRPGHPAPRPTQEGYLWTGAAAALAATWAWLSVADVTLLEAYTLPAAAGALAAGQATRRRRQHPSSWLTLGPGLAVALLPSLGAAVGGAGGATRPLLLTGGALLVVLAGARARLQAPLVLGGVTLLVLGLDALAPVAAQLPRWVTIGAAGLLLLWLGATAERRLARLRELREQFKES
jgi:hypothetical protein